MQDEPWEGDRLCLSPVGAGLFGTPRGATSWQACPGRQSPALPVLSSQPLCASTPRKLVQGGAWGLLLPKPQSQGFPPGLQSQPAMR